MAGLASAVGGLLSRLGARRGRSSEPAASVEPPPALDTLPPAILERIAAHLAVKDVCALHATSVSLSHALRPRLAPHILLGALKVADQPAVLAAVQEAQGMAAAGAAALKRGGRAVHTADGVFSTVQAVLDGAAASSASGGWERQELAAGEAAAGEAAAALPLGVEQPQDPAHNIAIHSNQDPGLEALLDDWDSVRCFRYIKRCDLYGLPAEGEPGEPPGILPGRLRLPIIVEFTATHSFDDPPTLLLSAISAGGAAVRYLLEPFPKPASPIAVVATSCFGGKWMVTSRSSPPPLKDLLPSDLAIPRRADLEAMQAAMGQCFRFVDPDA